MATYYISPSGNNANAGTYASPWLTLAYAISNTSANDTIVCLDGTYTLGNQSITNRTIEALNRSGAIFDAGNGGAKWSLLGDVLLDGLIFQNIVGAADAALFGLFGNSAATTYNYTFNHIMVRNYVNSATYATGVFGSAYEVISGKTVNVTIAESLFYNISKGAGAARGLFLGGEQYGSGFAINYLVTNSTFHTKSSGANQMNYFAFVYNGVSLIVKNSILYNGGGGVMNYVGGTPTPNTLSNSDTYLVTGVPSGTNNITSDPLFVDPANGIFRLRPTSPCLNAGVNP